MPKTTRFSRRARIGVTLATATTAAGLVLAAIGASPAAARPRVKSTSGPFGGRSTMVVNSWYTMGSDIMSLTCPWGSQAVGTPVSLRFTTSNSGLPVGSQHVMALVSGPGYATSVGGQSGNRGLTGYAGTAAVDVVAYAAGTVTVRGVWDYNGDGVWQPGFEPTTEPVCTFSAG